MSRKGQESGEGNHPSRAASVARDSLWPVGAALAGVGAGLYVGEPVLVGAGAAGMVLFPVINWVKSGRSRP